MNKIKTLVVWLVLIGGAIILLSQNKKDELAYRKFNELRRNILDENVSSVRIHNDEIIVHLNSGDAYKTIGTLDDKAAARLSSSGASILYGEEKSAFQQWLPAILIGAVVMSLVWFFFRRVSGQSSELSSLRKSTVRMLPEASKVKFSDVGGCEEPKQILGDIIDFLRNPKRWSQSGVRLPRGILLEGPPGCGKTLLARAVAGETNAKFYFISASEFVEMFVGVGAARVRDTFEIARKNAPAVVFIDELDAVGRRRGSGVGSSHDEREQTLNQLLTALDAIESSDPVVVIAATNRPDILDQALLRPGRFDRRVRIPLLSLDARLEALKIHTKSKPLAADVSLDVLAGKTDGFSGAQIETLANEAAILAVRRAIKNKTEKVKILQEDLEQAMQPATSPSRIFNKLDAVLIESTTQLSEPTGRAVLRAHLDGDGQLLEGELMWADSHFLKIRNDEGQVILPKAQISRIVALEGTESADPLEVASDPWSGRVTDSA